MSDVRRVILNVEYQDTNISKEINQDLLNCNVSDSADGSADEITIELQDKESKWLKDWVCASGDKIVASATALNWRHSGDEFKKSFGTFYVDEPEYNFKPTTFHLKGISFPATGGFRDIPRTQTFKNVKISKLAQTCCDRYGYTLALDIETDKTFKEIEQSNQSDFDFLKSEICSKNDICIKLYDNKLVLFSQSVYEKKAPVKEISINSFLPGANFKRTLTDSGYDKAVLKFKKNNGVLITAEYKVPNSKGIKPLILNDSVETQAEALELCKAKLREKNRKEITASFSLTGLTDLFAGDTIKIVDAGQFDGVYYIDKINQSLIPTTANFEIHKTLNY